MTKEDARPVADAEISPESVARPVPSSGGTAWLVPAGKYRRDIDGLRALAVVAVIAFHAGYLPAGYLGVDVFFVISGYLITQILYNESKDGRPSIINFYLRRTRRIIPLVLAVNIAVLIAGLLLMLPDDLENLAQSVFATNVFSNNILQLITTRNYWDVVNDYKPLIHTWSLGVEEQYYMLYPLIFLTLFKARLKWIAPLLVVLSAVSIVLYFSNYDEATIFYLLPFRFFELSLGGLGAVLLTGRLVNHRLSLLLILPLAALLVLNVPYLHPSVRLLLVILLTLGLLVSYNGRSKLASALIENRAMVAIGLISFSLYMWHQPILAFARYFVYPTIDAKALAVLVPLTILLSIVTYLTIERPFRNKNVVGTRKLLVVVTVAYLITTGVSLYLHRRAGIIRDVPELDISTASIRRGIHSQYNHQVRVFDRAPFKTSDHRKVLVVGNSMARDWANVLMESPYRERLDLSYSSVPESDPTLDARMKEADFIFVQAQLPNLDAFLASTSLDRSKLWFIGTKNFGKSNGIFYNAAQDDYFRQRTRMEDGIWETHEASKAKWGDRYINLIDLVIDQNHTVPVFTPDHKFISQDCRHFTRAGARYFATLVEPELVEIFGR